MDRPLVVLQATPRPNVMTNPYTILLRDHLDALDDVQAHFFSWRDAFLTRYDVYHSHWPDIIVRGRTPVRRAVRQARVLAFLLRIRASKTSLVRTVHNIGYPAGLTRREYALLRMIDRMTSLQIVLNEHTPVDDGVPVALVPHGHYKDWFAPFPKPEFVPGRLAYVGRVRPYKGVERLISAFRELTDAEDLSLRIAGYAGDSEVVDQLTRLAGNDERIVLRFAMLTDAELVSEVSTAELVVLPYERMHNSGAALMALSLGRPVLVPRNAVNDELAAEVGDGWVLTYQGPLTSSALRAAVLTVRSTRRTAEPDLSARDWQRSAQAHREAYRRAIRGRE